MYSSKQLSCYGLTSGSFYSCVAYDVMNISLETVFLASQKTYFACIQKLSFVFKNKVLLLTDHLIVQVLTAFENRIQQLMFILIHDNKACNFYR